MSELIKQEWKKLLRIKAVPLLLFVMLVLSLALYGRELYGKNSYSVSAYLTLHETIDKGNLTAEAERLENLGRTMIQSQLPPETMFTDSLGKEFLLYNQLVDEIEQVAGYERYLASINKNAQKKLYSTLYQQQESALREAEKVINDFAVMEGVRAELYPTKGMVQFFNMDLQEFFLVIAVFLVAATLVSVELEEGTIRLLRCMKNGRKWVVYAKALAGAGIVAVYVGLHIALRFLLTVLGYGTACLSGSIVCLYGAAGCTLPITVGQGVLLFVVLKLFAYLALFFLLLLLALIFQQPWKIYLFAGGPVALFWAAYALIDTNSWLAGFKWMNPVAFLDTGTLLLSYKNIMLFGHPVTYRICMLVVCAVLVLLGIVFFGRAFLTVFPGRQSGGGRLFGALERMVAVLTGRRSLWGFELRKWSFYQSGGVIILLLAAGLFLTYTPVADQVYTEEEIYYRYYVRQVEGEWSEEKMTTLRTEQARLAELEQKLQSGEVQDAMMVSYYSQQLKRQPGLTKVIQYGEFLEQQGGGSFIYEQGYERLLGKREPVTLFLYRCISLAVMTFLSVLLYGIEQRTGMKQLIRVSFAGEKKLRRRKWGNTLVMGAAIFAVVYIPWFVNVFSVYGTNGISAPSYCLIQMGVGVGLPAGVTVGALLVAYYGLHLGYLWVIGLLTGVIAEKIKHPLVASLAAFGLGMLPVLLLGMK